MVDRATVLIDEARHIEVQYVAKVGKLKLSAFGVKERFSFPI